MITVIVIGLLLTALVCYGDYRLSSERRQAQMARELENVQGMIEVTLQQYLTLILSLEAFVHANDDLYGEDERRQRKFGERFQRFAESLEQNTPSAMSLQLAPQGIVTYLTQVERNGRAQGHDLLRDDQRRAQVIDTIRKRSIVIAGPLTLIQGGEALIVRKAVFTHQGEYSAERIYQQGRAAAGEDWPHTIDSDFWGFATMLVSVDKLYADLKLLELPHQYTFALKGRHGLGDSGEVFWGQSDIFEAPDLATTIELPAGKWVLAMQDHGVPLWIRSLLIGLPGLVLTLLAAYALYSHQRSLRAVAASEASHRFLASMSHEIRTPMNGIIGVAQLLEKTSLSDKQQALLGKILASSKLLLRLVNDVLDFSKIEAGAMKLVEGSYSLQQVMQQAIALVEVEASKKSLVIELVCAESLPPILRGDEIRVEQILVNLLGNAVKFTEAGNITLAVSTDMTPSRERIIFAVTDTGIGMSDRERRQLFRPFSQLDASMTKRFGGTGLGLVISRQLARQMGGDISVRSVPGKGSEFRLSLPLEIGEAAADADRVQQPAGPSTHPELVRILVVDDMEMNTDVAVMMLEDLGYAADVAHSAKAAIAAVGQHDYDIIFMDRQMPEMDGLEATRTIRQQLGDDRHPWIIAMTASAQEDEKQEYFDSGANDFLGKPIDFEGMTRIMRNYLQRKRD